MRIKDTHPVSTYFQHLKGTSMLSRSAIAAVALSLSPVAAYANPTNPTVVAGSYTFQQLMQILNIYGGSGIINWDSFNINPNETVNFVLNSNGDIVLNRVTGSANASQILGQLNSNGTLVLVNQAGVVFGAGAQVNVGGLIASTADITDDNFNAGNMNFDIAGNADARIVNRGTITAADGGLVALVAPMVLNSGVIQANLGEVVLASGETFQAIDLYGDGLYSFTIDQASAAGAHAAVKNTGHITANGGKVILTAKVAGNVLNDVINNTGIIEANSASMKDGVIILDGGNNGHVHAGGTITASGGAAASGGVVQISGQNVTLDGARVVADGNVSLSATENLALKNGALVDAGRNINANAGGDVSLQQGSALRSTHNLNVTASNVTLQDSLFRSGSDTNITIPGALMLLGDSKIGIGGDGNIINRHFYSQNSNTLTARGDLDFYQSGFYSIQNAIDAVNKVDGHTTLNLHAFNSWVENVFIDLDNLTVRGSNIGPSTVYAAGPGSVFHISNSSNVTLSNITIDATGAANGVLVEGSRAVKVARSTISGANRSDIALHNSNGVVIRNNHIISDVGVYGIFADEVDNLKVNRNRISGISNPQPGNIAVFLRDSNGAVIRNNSVKNFWNGVVANTSDALTVMTNAFDRISGTAVALKASQNARIMSNDITQTRTGIRLENGSHGAIVDGNTLTVFRDGVLADSSDDLRITDNDVNAALFNGIHITNGNNLQIGDNTVTAGMTGISLDTIGNGVIYNNMITGAGRHGIRVGGSNGVLISGNNLLNNNSTGALVFNSAAVTVNGNVIQGNGNGLIVDSTDGVIANGNIFDNNVDAGLYSINSNNGLYDGNIFSNNAAAMRLDNSSNALITNANVTVASGGTGLEILNGSGNTLVGGLVINGSPLSSTGVLIDGLGSGMQFTGNNSFFSNLASYFILQNNAMQGEVLDASQQTFAGTRASNFTRGQLGTAEDNHTLDSEDSVGLLGLIGDVFYKRFDDTPPPPPNLNALNEFEQDELELYRTGLFSYAGGTIQHNNAFTSAEQETSKVRNFQLAELDLSLLSPAASGINAPQAQALSIASLPPGELANLAPAAGGNASALANLAPAAGGPLLSPDCGTNFLDTGFKPGFSTATCSVQ